MTEKAGHFIHEIIEEDLRNGRHEEIVTRFPPEPNGYLHIGHAKSICLNFTTAAAYGGICNLRFDDTNPVKEEQEYIDAIQDDVRWLGFDWEDRCYYASDYFDRMYECAVELIRRGGAYVCTLTPEEFKEYRGVPTRPGRESPWRDRPVAENLDLFERMKNGEFEDGAYVLRAKIDMNSPNLHLRDPAMYRIRKAIHPHTGDRWCVYPMYDFAHGLEDSFEGVTHSICTLEFEVHRPLYDWFLEALGVYHPRQIEFARLNLTYTVMSKRKLLELVERGLVRGWDDPRLPTLRGLRRRGVPPEAIRTFCEMIGVTKYESLTDIALLEHCIRDVMNRTARRRMAVLDPVRLVIENVPADGEDVFEAVNNPEDASAGTRPVPFSRELWIERDDFMEDPPAKYFRLAPGREVRLRYACLVTCTGFEKDAEGRIAEIRCRMDPDSRGGNAPDGRKVRGTIHWVSARHAIDAEVRLIDRLFAVEDPSAAPGGADWTDALNPDSMRAVRAKVESVLAEAVPGDPLQFERIGYFTADPDSTPDRPVFNRTVTLRESKKKPGA
jgi:glutaminyl-tRNA synthetase